MSTSSKTDSFDENPQISVGYISAAHGVKGEVRLVPLTDFPRRFAEMPVLNLYLNGSRVRSLSVKRVREHESKGEWIVESDVASRDEAEALVGAEILIDRDERAPLPEGSFWIDDLIGLTVQNEQSINLGTVEDFVDAGGGELYAVRDELGKVHYIPAVEAFVKNIDLTAKKITVRLIEGLWE